MRRLLVLLLALSAAACSTGPEEPPDTIVVKFADAPTDSDVAALRAVGGSTHRTIALARAVAMRAAAALAARYQAVPGVREVGSLGTEDDPEVSVFITFGVAPTDDDAAFVRATGARSAHIVPDERIVSAVIPLSRVQALSVSDRIVGVDISIEPLRPQL